MVLSAVSNFATASSDQSIQDLAPTFAQLGNAFAYTGDIIIAQVDADSSAGAGTAIEYGVAGFPSTYSASYHVGRSRLIAILRSLDIL